TSAESPSMTDSSDSESASARIAFLRGLRAVRQLRPDLLPDSVLHDILEVARWCCARRFRWDIQPSTFSGRPTHPVESHSSSLSIGNTTDVYLAKRRRRCVAVATLLGVEANPRHASSSTLKLALTPFLN